VTRRRCLLTAPSVQRIHLESLHRMDEQGFDVTTMLKPLMLCTYVDKDGYKISTTDHELSDTGNESYLGVAMDELGMRDRSRTQRQRVFESRMQSEKRCKARAPNSQWPS
jgi:hypothetical protein